MHVFTVRSLCSLALLWFTPGCTNLIEFTQGLRTEYDLEGDRLKGLQFYVSHKIVLRRELSSGESKVVKGRLFIEAGKRIEEVVVEPGTPGVCLKSVETTGAEIGFEEGDDSATLTFGCGRRARGRYKLYGTWRGRSGQVEFAGNTYTAIGVSHMAHLLIDKNALFRLERVRRRLRGRRVSGAQ